MKKHLLSISLFFLQVFAVAQPVSPFTGDTLNTDSLNGDFRFLVSGHFHGSSSNVSGYPASTLLGNLDGINALQPEFTVCLGDLFLDVRNDIPFFQQSLFAKLQHPLFNAVGNHDLSGKVYQDNFGATFFDFYTENQSFIVLDTEMHDGSIKSDQLELFKSFVEQSRGKQHAFIFTHRPVWIENNDEIKHLFQDNTQSLIGNNFESEILPMLKELSQTTEIYLFSGSMGGMAPVSFFYYSPQEGMHFINTAIRNLKRDAMVVVDIREGVVKLTPFSLTGQELEPIQHYDKEYWNKRKGKKKPFNYRLLPLYTWQIVASKAFWIGGACFLILYFIIRKIIRRKKR